MGIINYKKWLEPSILPGRLLPPRPPESPLPTNLPRVRLLMLPPPVSRDPTDSSPEPSSSERSEDSKNLLNSSLENFLSKDLSERSPTISRPILDSNPPPSSLSKRPLRLTWLDSSRTPTSVPSTLRELPSCPRTCNSPEESEVRDPEH